MRKQRDIKYEYHLRAEEIAQEEYNLDYYDLSWEDQMKVYDRAMIDVYERLILQAEARRDG